MLVVVENATTYTVRATTGTLEEVSFLKAGLKSLSIDGLGGNDSITVDANLTLNGALKLDAESITVKSGRSVTGATDITLTASAQDNGKIEEVIANLGTIDVAFPVDLKGFFYSKPTALIDLTGATLVGDAITLNASASAPLNPDAALFKKFEGTGVYVKSSAEIKIVNTKITADSLSVVATSNVSSAEKAEAEGTTATADAGISVAVVDSSAIAEVGGTSVLTVSGAVSIESSNTINIDASVDGGIKGTTVKGATLAVAVAEAETRAILRGSASITGGADSVTIKATTNNTAKSSATSTAGGAEKSATPAQKTKTEKVLADPDGPKKDKAEKAKTADGDVSFAGAVAVTFASSNTVAFIDTSGTIVSASNINVSSSSTDNSSATATGKNTGGTATGVGVAVALNFADVISDAHLSGTGSLQAADTIDVSATLAGDDGFSASATSGSGKATKVGVAGSLAINIVNTDVKALVTSGANLNLNNSKLKLATESTTKTTTTADAQQTEAGKKGIGASVALGISSNRSRAEVESNANFRAADSVTISAVWA